MQELVESAHDIGYDATVYYLLPMVQNLASDPEVLVRQSLMQHFGDLAGEDTKDSLYSYSFILYILCVCGIYNIYYLYHFVPFGSS